MAGMTSIMVDLDYYSETYQTLTRYSLAGSIGDWLEASFCKVVVDKLATKLSSLQTLKVLGIGSGAGNLDCAMLEKLHLPFPKIENTIVEPSDAQLSLFKQLVSEKQDVLKGVTFDWKAETLDQFTEGPNDSKFHLIHAIHVLYYTNELEKTLRALYDSLQEGGIFFIIMISKESAIAKIHSQFPEVRKMVARPLMTDAVVTSALESLGMPFTAQRVPRRIQGTLCFDETSPDGRHLLDFLTHTKDFRKTAPNDLRERVLQYIRSPECGTEEDGHFKICRDWVYITVAK